VRANVNGAEAAFEATFRGLLRQAAAVRKRPSRGSWLYGVAWRVARQAGARAAVRRDREREAVAAVSPPEPPDELAGSELRAALDREMQRLAEKDREAGGPCSVGGKNHGRAAQEM